MVHCISSSEPDSADINSQNSENDWRNNHQIGGSSKTDYLDVTSGQMQFSKKSTPTHIAFAESSSSLMPGSQYITEQMKPQDSMVSSRNYEKMMLHKRKSNENIIILEELHTSLFEDDNGMYRLFGYMLLLAEASMWWMWFISFTLSFDFTCLGFHTDC